ncbi:MAG: ATP-dependent DNA helicase RecG, partial [Rhizomicrobium sp.]
MRPAILFPLFAEIHTLSGVGPKLERLIAKVAGPKIVDLLFNLPVGVTDRSYRPRVSEAEPGRIATLEVSVLEHLPPRVRSQPYKVRVSDGTGVVELVFFRGDPKYLAGILPAGSRRLVSGRIESFKDRLTMPHPDFAVAPEDAGSLPVNEAIYGLTEGLATRTMAKAVKAALERLPQLAEWQDRSFLQHQHYPSFNVALRSAHAPRQAADLGSDCLVRRRLAYDELLANQLALLLTRARLKTPAGRRLVAPGKLKAGAVRALPFSLTRGQKQALSEIEADMAAERRMLRLLQGDVGSGKTIVAFLALLDAVEAGLQGALMAPTDLLVRQHLETLAPYAHPAGVRLMALTGRERGRERAQTLARLASGDVDILVGTHALFSQEVSFRDLGLVVVDEQHRFGVHQRMQLQGKGKPADVLVMTATPIPRTLALTAYGDMDVSRIEGRPPGRKPVATRVIPAGRLDEVIARLKRALDHGEQAYWVCPSVEESEASDLAAARERAQMLGKTLAGQVGLIHGRMKALERDAAMAAFGKGDTGLLVATTVIEVGVDVPAATIMVVEHAERFGLAQLHQLRGRIGRGQGRSYCLLLEGGLPSETAAERLRVLAETNDGFRIAETDFKIRGPG